MFKPVATILAAALILSPVAAASGLTQVTLTMNYDAEKLETEAGTAEIVSELRREARKLCTHRLLVIGAPMVDQACADSLVKEAIQQIHADQSAAGRALSPAFKSLVTVNYAEAN
ncbi:UrcA family protein [Hyphomonas sp.]|uniref:UrcA family protein n=1 Tax=Hyphomonas sp. TaxID=87 RepID=UPI00391DD96F